MTIWALHVAYFIEPPYSIAPARGCIGDRITLLWPDV